MPTTKEDPVDEATYDSGIRDADHGTGSEQHRLHRGIKKIPIKSNGGKPPPPKSAPGSGG